MVVSAVGVALIASQIGLTARGQAIAAALAIAVPIGIAEAPTTQTDYVLTMWVVAMLATARVDVRTAVPLRTCAVFTGFLALALLTKPTAYFYATPVLVFFVVRQVRGRVAHRRWGLLLRDAAAVAAVVLVVNAVSLARNVETFGTPFGDATNTPPTASAGQTLVENSVRSLALQLGTPVGRVNQLTTRATSGALDAVGLSVNSPTSTKQGVTFDVGFSTREDNAGSLAHTVLSLVACAYLLARRRRTHRLALLVAALATGGFLLRSLGQPFSPYLSRYLLTWFVLMTPVTAAFLTCLPRRLATAATAAVCASSLLWAVAADLRPLAGSTWLHAAGGAPILSRPRTEQYFAVRPELAQPYEQAARQVHALRATRVGIIGGENAFEYPMWVLLKAGHPEIRIEHVAVTSTTRDLQSPAVPDVVVCLESCAAQPAPDQPVSDFGPVRVWSPR